MNHKQKIEFQHTAERYLEKNKINTLFEGLLKSLMIDKPDAPIDYLIEKLKGKEIRKLFLVGPAGVLKHDIAKVISQRFGLKIIHTKEIIKEEVAAGNQLFKTALQRGEYIPDRAMIEAVKTRIAAMEAKQKSYILTGFPRTKVQAIALQRAGIIPERVFFVQGSESRFVATYRERYGLIVGADLDPAEKIELVESTEMEVAALRGLQEYDYNIGGVRESYSFLSQDVDGTTDLPQIIDRISRVLSIRGRTKRPAPPPKVLLFGPPGSGRTTQATLVAQKYGLVKISAGEIIRQEIDRHSEVGEVLGRVELGRLGPDEVVIDLIRQRLQQTDCRLNGWIMEGFPRNKVQAQALSSLGFDPTHVFFLNASDALVYSRMEERKVDPISGIYYSGNNPPPNDEVRLRLLQDPADEADIVKNRLRQYKSNSTALMAEFQKVSVMVKAELEIDMITERIGEPLEQAF